MPFLASEGCFWPLTAFMRSEVKKTMPMYDLAVNRTYESVKTFGLGSKIRDVEVSGLKNHNFLPLGCSSNLIGSAKGFLRLLSNFY